MKMIKFREDIFITKTNDEAIIILDGETDEFWGMDGPLSTIILSIFENKSIDLDDILLNVLEKYNVSQEELIIDVKDCFETLVQNKIASYE